jgi:DNA-binding transcriptional LysR family regulator
VEEGEVDLAAVNAFVQAAELKSFAAAVATLDVKASGVGKAVDRLEARFGLRLMNGTMRSLCLMPDGGLLRALPKRAVGTGECNGDAGRDRRPSRAGC